MTTAGHYFLGLGGWWGFLCAPESLNQAIEEGPLGPSEHAAVGEAGGVSGAKGGIPRAGASDCRPGLGVSLMEAPG